MERADPPAGDGHYYIVRAANACGNGTYGADSSQTEREPGNACP